MVSVPATIAVLAGEIFTGLAEVCHDPDALDSPGVWVVVAPFEGDPVCARFTHRRPGTVAAVAAAHDWIGPDPGTPWVSSLRHDAFVEGVTRIRAAIAAGELDQVNLTRRCSAPLQAGASPLALGAALAAANPAPHAATVVIPTVDLAVVSASPELFLQVEGDRIWSSPIKGTATPGGAFPAKDYTENRLVAGVVERELRRVCVAGSVRRTADCITEPHPGLDHLVSTVTGRLAPGVGWADLFDVLAPPASVTGTPRRPARALIDELEPVDRGPYCGAIGLIDNERGRAVLSVAIRTFWFADGALHFGTGAGITAGSDPQAEWDETELKAARLLAVASARPGTMRS